MEKQFDYLFCKINEMGYFLNDVNEWQPIDSLGAEGWEAVSFSCLPEPEGDVIGIVLFKRERPRKTPVWQESGFRI